MALRFLEGFETGRDGAVVTRKYDSARSVIGGDLGREEGFSDFSGDAAESNDHYLVTFPLVGAASNDWICGLAYRPESTLSVGDPGSTVGVTFENTDGEQIRFVFTSVPITTGSVPAGKRYYQVQVYRGATLLATSNEDFWISNSEQAWIYFEFKVTIDNTVGSFEGRYYNRKAKNGIQTLTWDSANTNVDTQNQTSTGVDRFGIDWRTGNATLRASFDDLYVLDDTGAKNNDYLGPIGISGQIIPDAAAGEGDTTQWELQGGAVDTEDAWQEPDTSAEDDKRLKASTSLEVHLAALDPLNDLLREVTIVGLAHTLYGRMETTGSLTISHRYRKTTGSPAETNSGSFAVSSTTVVANTEVHEDDPNTGTDWVLADIDGLQVGAQRS